MMMHNEHSIPANLGKAGVREETSRLDLSLSFS